MATPLNDAADIGAALGRLGFAVTRIDDADQGELRRGLRDFAASAGAAETAVVFYAGHGIAIGGRNYLVPVDARLASVHDAEFEAVPLELVERAVGRATNVRLIVLDASRQSPFAAALQRGETSGPIAPGLARMEPSAGTLVVHAAEEGSVALDSQGRNSVYSEALLRHLEEPGLEMERLFREVQDTVLAATGGKQRPSLYGALSDGNVSLDGEPVGLAEAPATGAPTEDGTGEDLLRAEKLAAERLFWESVEDSEDPAEIQTYLDRYPDGTYAALARARLNRLNRTAGSASDVSGSASDSPAVHEAGTDASTELAEQDPALDPRAAEEWLELQPDHRRLIQAGLAALGFDPGPVDGVFGQRTRTAIGDWQASEGKAATGYLDMEAARALARKGAETPSPSEQREQSNQAAMDTLAKALQAAAKVEDDSDRASVLAEIAVVLAMAGDRDRANQSIALALDSVQRIQTESARDSALYRIPPAQAAAGDIAAALATAERITDDLFRELALTGIAMEQARAGDLKGAFATSERTEDDEPRAHSVAGIAQVQAETGDRQGAAQSFQAAMAIAERIEDDYSRVSTLYYIALAQAEAGDTRGVEKSIGRALAAVERMAADSRRDLALSHIANMQALVGDVQAVLATAARIPNERRNEPSVLHSIAVAQAEEGDIMAALATTGRITDEFYHHTALTDIAKSQARKGNVFGAVATAKQNRNELNRDYALLQIVMVQAKEGDVRGALARAERIPNEEVRALAFARIAAAQISNVAR